MCATTATSLAALKKKASWQNGGGEGSAGAGWVCLIFLLLSAN